MVPGFAKRAIRGTVVSKLADELAARLADHTEEAIDLVVRTRGAAIQASVEVERLRHPQLTPRELADKLVHEKTKLVAGTGAASALPGAFPGVGSAVEIGAAVADAALLVYNQVAMVLAVACVYGRDLRDFEARKLDVLLAFAMEAGVAVPAGKTIEVLGERVTLGVLPREAVARVNRRIGGEVVKRIGRRRAKVILGREIPLGIGVAIGAGFNYAATRRMGRAAIKYFETIQ
jgi:uncharacterized protein (DUF697 family)